MRYWLGLACASAGVWLLSSALARRQRILAERSRAPGTAVTQSNSPLAILGDVMPTLVSVFLVYAAIKSTFAFFVLDGLRVLSLFDLGAFLFLLAAYGTWVVMKSKYREPQIAHQRPVTAALTASNDNDTEAATTAADRKPRMAAANDAG